MVPGLELALIEHRPGVLGMWWPRHAVVSTVNTCGKYVMTHDLLANIDH
jgi:hypothetical protein